MFIQATCAEPSRYVSGLIIFNPLFQWPTAAAAAAAAAFLPFARQNIITMRCTSSQSSGIELNPSGAIGRRVT